MALRHSITGEETTYGVARSGGLTTEVADRIRERADRARYRAQAKVDGLRHLFGHGVAQELAQAIDDITEEGSELEYALRDVIGNLTGEVKRLRSEYANLAARHNTAIAMGETAITELERRAARSKTNPHPIVSNWRAAWLAPTEGP